MNSEPVVTVNRLLTAMAVLVGLVVIWAWFWLKPAAANLVIRVLVLSLALPTLIGLAMPSLAANVMYWLKAMVTTAWSAAWHLIS